MRQNQIRILIILACAIGAVAAAFVERRHFGREATSVVRIAFKATTSVREYDPSNIRKDTEALILDNIYSPLVRFSATGDLEPALAEKYWLEDRTLHFQIRKDMKTVDGHQLTPEDVRFSLMRILVSDNYTQKQLRLFICTRRAPLTVDSNCEGLDVIGDQVLLTVEKASYAPLLLKMLAAMNFGIIPRSSCDGSKPVPKIVDYANTSGPYFVIQDDPKGAFVLQSNPSHWLAHSGLIQTLEFYPALPDDSLKLLEDGDVDYVSGYNVEPSIHLKNLRLDPHINTFDTYPIKKLVVGTTLDQLNEFSIEERLHVYDLIREAYLKNPDSVGWRRSLDFFPSLGEGAMTQSQLATLASANEKSRMVKLHRPVTLGVINKRWKFFSKTLGNNPEIRLVHIGAVGPMVPRAERPDFYVVGTDTAFSESVSLISYDAESELLDLPKVETAAWMKRYMDADDKLTRTQMLRDLNFKTLQVGLIGVIGESAYTEVSKKPFSINGTKFFSGSPLWLIRQN